jgi:DNA-binding FadR family transcriptional regulator
LYEIRQRLELSYAREAVHQLTDESLNEMGQLLNEMEREFEAGKDFSMPDLALHRVLFRAVGNSTLIKLFDIFTAIYANSRHLFQAQPRDVMADDLQKHKLLLEALQQRDEELVIERLQSTYTPLPDLMVEPRKSNGA